MCGALAAHLEEMGDIISVYETVGDCVKLTNNRICARVLTIFTQHPKAACVALYHQETSVGART